MQLARRSFLCGSATLAVACASGAQSVSARELPAGVAETLDGLLSSLTELAMFNGTVTIDTGGEIAFRRSYGLADYEARTQFSRRTRFKVASLSKPMTDAALAAMLVRGELRFDDPLARFLPEFPGADRITIELITQHRSGIPHTNNQPWGDGATVLSHDEILARLAPLPLDFEPGARRSYSNGGYAVLARVMEMAHGAPYPEIMQDLVFTPLRMRDSGAIMNSGAPPPRLAKGYQPGLRVGERAPSRFYAAETRPGGGSIYASARDVMTFFQAAWRGRLPGADAYPGLFGGTGATRAADGRSPGQYMDVYYHRDTDMIVSSTANNYAAEFRWAENLAKIVLEQGPLFTALPPLATNREIAADHAWIGSYHNERDTASKHEIARSTDGQLVLTDIDDNRMSRALVPLADGSFLEPLYYGACRADPAQPGRIACGRLYDGGFTSVLVRSA